MKQREIKFRAWDKEEKRMVVDIKIDHKITINEYIRRIQEFYILMQYTGLKDKNGVEIYEGDILFEKWDRYLNYEPGCKTTVKWEYDRWNINAPQNGHKICNDYKVIGNVYENKDLLK